MPFNRKSTQIGQVLAVALMAAPCMLQAGAAHAQELRGQPGAWESTVNVQMSMTMANGQVMNIPGRPFTSKNCMKPEDSFKPEDITQGGCVASNIKQSPNAMSFDITCTNNGVSMTGTTSFELNAGKDAGTGKFTMQGDLPGVGKMAGSGTTTARRIGPC